MFFKKKKNPIEPVQWVAKKSIKKMDALVTGAILSGIIASLYGVKKLREKSDESSEKANKDAHHDEEKDNSHK